MALTMLEALARNLSVRFGFRHTLPANTFPANATGGAVTTKLPVDLDDRSAVSGSTVAAPGQGTETVASVTLVCPTALATSANNPKLYLYRVNQATGGDVAQVASLDLTAVALVAMEPASFTVNAANAALNPGEILDLRAVTPATTGAALPANCLVVGDLARA